MRPLIFPAFRNQINMGQNPPDDIINRQLFIARKGRPHNPAIARRDKLMDAEAAELAAVFNDVLPWFRRMAETQSFFCPNKCISDAAMFLASGHILENEEVKASGQTVEATFKVGPGRITKNNLWLKTERIKSIILQIILQKSGQIMKEEMNNYHFRRRLRIKICLVLTDALWLGVLTIQAGDRYVATNGTDSGTCETWGTAASNIQYAVDAAANGETVWVSNGIYYLTNQINVTKSITVRSFSGNWSNTIVNGNWPAYPSNRVFYLMNTGAVLSGLTITNGFVTNATYVSYAGGAGVYAAACLLITNCLVTGNATTSDTSRLWGVGIYLGSGTVSHCIIQGNRSLGRHADEPGVPGILIDNINNARRIVTNCVIANNSCSLASSRGAVYLYYNATTVTWCNVYGNINCSGIDVAGTLGDAEFCTIISNSYHGSVFKDNGILRNCLIARNGSMGAYFSSTAGGIMENCTVVSNASYGISSTAHSSANPFKIVNSIIYDNRGNPSVAQWSTTNIPFTNCCTYPLPDYAFNCITASPSFVNKDANNWRLKSDSPCVNAGTNQNWMTNSVDLGGTRRIRYGIVDIGAYEHICDGTLYRSY